MKKIFLFILTCNFHFCFSQSTDQILSKTLERINSLDCIVYSSFNSSSLPGDTLAFNSYASLTKFVLNNSDSIIGSSFLAYYNDTSRISRMYHNNLDIRYNWDNNTAEIDTINPEHPSLIAPFLIRVKALLNYAIANKNGVNYQLNDYKDSLQISFFIKNKIVEFSRLIPSICSKEDAVSKYALWIYKDFRPYKFIRKMPHQTSIEQITYLFKVDCIDIFEKQIGIYLPIGFKIRDKKGTEININEIEGKLASNWTLENVEGDSVRLSQFKGKNLLVEFTGVGCGPCHAAIPLLRKIAEDYKNKDLNLISIESYSKNKTGLKRYKDLNQINYEFLISNKETLKNYKILAVPVFIFINKSGVIEKVIVGYQKDKTDIEINDCLNKMK